MPPILLVVFHCSLYRERISSWGAAGLFQFPLLREGRRGKSCTTSSFLRFQFTLLREGRLPTVCHASPPKAFQFTPLREGRPAICFPSSPARKFQFTPLREGRPSAPEALCARGNFNSRPSARGDEGRGQSGAHWAISIHAPPRGATCQLTAGQWLRLFQFTPLREGRRKGWNDAKGKAAEISIHAPPRGATEDDNGNVLGVHDFNSRPSARGDVPVGLRLTARIFQFTPLREGRPTM